MTKRERAGSGDGTVSVADEGWPAWLCETVRSVHETLDSAETAPQLGTTLPDSLTANAGVIYAWVGTSRERGIRVRSVAWEVDVPSPLSVDGETLTERTETTNTVQAQTDSAPDAHRVLSYASENPDDVGAFFGIPLRAADSFYGVLHLYVSSEPSHEGVLASLGRAIGRRLRAFETDEQLARERRRLEEARSLLSHDLGNPLNIASGRVELARVDDDTSHLDSVDGALEQVDELRERSVRLVEIGQQPVEAEPLSLSALARDSWEDVRGNREDLIVEDATLLGERERTRMLLNELFRNALVHSDEAVTVEVGPLSGVDGFYVADDGPGIPADEREYVLDTGYTTVPGREGIGLSIVTEIAGAHGWHVAVEPGEPSGTRVEIVTSRW